MTRMAQPPRVKSLARLIEARRKELGLNTEQAIRVTVSRGTWHGLQNGTSPGSPATWLKLERGLRWETDSIARYLAGGPAPRPTAEPGTQQATLADLLAAIEASPLTAEARRHLANQVRLLALIPAEGPAGDDPLTDQSQGPVTVVSRRRSAPRKIAKGDRKRTGT